MLKDFLRRKAAATLVDALTPPSQQRQQQLSADPLAPPERANDPRIIKYDGGYRNDCWLWQDEDTTEEVKSRAWQERYKRPHDNLVNKCGQTECVKPGHLQSINFINAQSLLRLMENFLESGGGPPGIASSAFAIKINRLSRSLDWDHREWTCLFNISRAEFEAAYDEGMSELRARRAVRESAPPAAEPSAPPTGEPVAAVAPPPAPSPPAAAMPEPPAMPVLLKMGGPLGKPENLTAQLGSEPGQVVLSWAPGKNAAVHVVGVILPGSTEGVSYPAGFPGGAGAATFGGVAAGLWHFTVLAGEQDPDASDGFSWSEQSDWASIIVP